MPSFFPSKRRRRLAAKTSLSESSALTEEVAADRLSSLSRQLREDAVDALVAEGERVWDAISSRLEEHVARIQTEARGDTGELERRIRVDLEESLPEVPTRAEIEELVADAAAKEFAKATERIASMLLVHRKQTNALLERELQTLREELRPKLVMRRAEIPAPEEAPHRREAFSD